MTERTEIVHMDRAVRPNIFDVYAEPDLVWAIVLANLMSPFLWDLSEKVQARGEAHLDINRYIDAHFTHVLAREVAEQIGVLDLAAERERIGGEAVDRAAAAIAGELDRRSSLGRLDPGVDIRPLIRRGQFPSFFYATIDEAHAYRTLAGKRKHKPVGVTSCVDEAALVAGLIAIGRNEIPDHLMIFGSPTHYTAFTTEADGAWWYNGKHEFFAREGWRELAPDSEPVLDQDEFDARLPGFDRVMTPLGHYVVSRQESTIPATALRSLLSDLSGFFGRNVRQIREAEALEDVRFVAPFSAEPVRDVLPAEGPEAVLKTMREVAARHPGSLQAAALYCFRDLQVPEPRHYLTAALRSHRTAQYSEKIATVSDALDVLDGIGGRTSIFATRDRLSMPDEVLYFSTGTDRDRALLLFVLLHGSERIDPALRSGLEIVFTRGRSFVRGPGLLVDADSLETVDEIDSSIELLLALS